MPEDNGKQNPDNFLCSYGYKLVFIDNEFRKPFKSDIGGDAIYNIINNMLQEGKYCSYVMEKDFNKERVMTKKDNENFDNSAESWICDNNYLNGDVKVRDHCHITGKYRGSVISRLINNIKVK